MSKPLSPLLALYKMNTGVCPLVFGVHGVFLRRQASCFFIGILGLCLFRLSKWPHLFVIKFVYWWWNVCIIHDDSLMYRHACKNVGSELPDGAVHVFSSCLVCFEELTFLLMLFPKWLRDKQSTLNEQRHYHIWR